MWVATGQHRELLRSAQGAFAITPDFDFDLMNNNQPLAILTGNLALKLDTVLAAESPDMVVVQGDTTTALAATLCAYYRRIPVAHVEAGLRSRDLDNPYPEESNRRLIGVMADLHFAPTPQAARNLLDEGAAPGKVMVTGNTVVDALEALRDSIDPAPAALTAVPADHRVLLVTAHRREAWGDDLASICQALLTIRDRIDDVEIVFPVHPNPNVRRLVLPMLGNERRIHLIDPLNYLELLSVMRRAYLVLTDSGGLQEEAPSFHLPVLVMRRLTERPEAVRQGLAKIVGTAESTIIAEACRLLNDPEAYAGMTSKPNPFGDGRAAERIVRAISHFLTGSSMLLAETEQFAA